MKLLHRQALAAWTRHKATCPRCRDIKDDAACPVGDALVDEIHRTAQRQPWGQAHRKSRTDEAGPGRGAVAHAWSRASARASRHRRERAAPWPGVPTIP